MRRYVNDDKGVYTFNWQDGLSLVPPLLLRSWAMNERTRYRSTSPTDGQAKEQFGEPTVPAHTSVQWHWYNTFGVYIYFNIIYWSFPNRPHSDSSRRAYRMISSCIILYNVNKRSKKKTASDDIQHLIMSLMLAIKMCSMPIVYLYIGIWQYHVLSAYQQHQINVHVLADSFTCLYAAVSYTRSYVLLCGYHVADWYVSIAWIMRCDRQNPMLHQLLDLSFNNRVQYVLIQKCRQKNQEDLSSILLLLCISHN